MDKKDVRGFSMTISTVILMVLGIMILIGLMSMFVFQVGFFKDTVTIYSDKTNVDSFVEGCNILSNLKSDYSYCCDEKTVKLGNENEILVTCDAARDLSWSSQRINEVSCVSVSC
jgi:hypothetical protein